MFSLKKSFEDKCIVSADLLIKNQNRMLIINKQTIIAGADPRNLPCNYCAQLSILNIQHYLYLDGHGIGTICKLD